MIHLSFVKVRYILGGIGYELLSIMIKFEIIYFRHTLFILIIYFAKFR